MKLHLSILTAALLVAGLSATADASDRKPVYNSKGQLIALVPNEAAPARAQAVSGPTHYVASPSGKGGAVTPSTNSGGVTSIAVFKSNKAASCCDKAKKTSCCD